MIQKRQLLVGEGPVNFLCDPRSKGAAAFISCQVGFPDLAPVSEAEVTVQYEAAEGDDFVSTILVAEAQGARALTLVPSEFPQPLGRDDKIRVLYDNPDDRQIGITVFMDDDYYAR